MNKSQLKATPLVGKGKIYFKREDLNPSGSVKDRAILSQLLKVKKEGKEKVAISSSGNAAISLAFWSPRFNLKATVFVSPKIKAGKLARLKEFSPQLLEVTITPRPISQCFRFCRQTGAVNLRQSLDPAAEKGFSSLGQELLIQIKEKEISPRAIFFPVSSGATLRGVFQGIKKLNLRFFLVQPAAHPPLASLFDQKYLPEEENICDALVARIIPQKEKIIKIIKKTGGGGVVVENKEIIKATEWLEKKGIKTSFEGGAALAGIWKAKKEGKIKDKEEVICLLTGKRYD